MVHSHIMRCNLLQPSQKYALLYTPIYGSLDEKCGLLAVFGVTYPGLEP